MSKVHFNRRIENRIYYSDNKILPARFNGEASSFLNDKPIKTGEQIKVMHELFSYMYHSNLICYDTKHIELHNSAQRHFHAAVGDRSLGQYILEDVERF